MEKFDLVVIGSGPGGYPAAIRAAQKNLKTALIEEADLGGTCLNRGCIPSKALIASAEMWHQISTTAKDFGIKVEQASFDYSAMVERKDQIVAKIRKSLKGLIESHGVQIIQGKAQFLSPKEIKINGPQEKTILAEKIIIATGSEPRIIPLFPVDGKRIHDSTSLLQMKTLPKSLIVIGGGVIGCEFASLYHHLGVEVTIFELMDRLLPVECLDVSKALIQNFKRRGIAIHTNAHIAEMEQKNDRVHLLLKSGQRFEADMVLVSVGRKINSDCLGLDKAGISTDKDGSIQINNMMETNVPGIYAIGDLTGKWWLAHVATHQGLIAADNCCGEKKLFRSEAVPSVIFTDPEIATVGLSPEKAKEAGHEVSVGRFPFQALGRSLASNHPEGFAQIVSDKKTGQILGGQVVGYQASTLISEISLAIENELVVESIMETIHPHPTLSEAWLEAAFLAANLPLHMPPQKEKTS